MKKFKEDTYYKVDSNALRFIEENYSIDDLYPSEDGNWKIKQDIWDKIYKKDIDKARTYIKEHQDELLKKVNDGLFNELWNKYCTGSLSKWEMDSVSCYFHPHELQHVNNIQYCIENYFTLSESPEIDRIYNIKGKQVPIFKLHRIAGTVLDRNKLKHSVTLLTTDGVVTVKIYGPVFSKYDKQISEKRADGTKKVVERSWFTRGNKIIVTGIRIEGDGFLAKKYNATPFNLIELIKEVKEDGELVLQNKRADEFE